MPHLHPISATAYPGSYGNLFVQLEDRTNAIPSNFEIPNIVQ